MMVSKLCIICGYQIIDDILCEHCGKAPLPKKEYAMKNDRRVNSLTGVFNPSSFSMFGDLFKISPEGFWIRGVKVEQGPNEAKEVYDTFIEYLRSSKKGD